MQSDDTGIDYHSPSFVFLAHFNFRMIDRHSAHVKELLCNFLRRLQTSDRCWKEVTCDSHVLAF